MPLRPELTDDEVSAMWAYLRTVPPITNALPRWPTAAHDARP
jgi:hypothetical protein